MIQAPEVISNFKARLMFVLLFGDRLMMCRSADFASDVAVVHRACWRPKIKQHDQRIGFG